MTSIEFIAGLKTQGILEGMTIGDAYPAYKEETQDLEEKDSFMKFRSAFIMYGSGKVDIPGFESLKTPEPIIIKEEVKDNTIQELIVDSEPVKITEPQLLCEVLKENTTNSIATLNDEPVKWDEPVNFNGNVRLSGGSQIPNIINSLDPDNDSDGYGYSDEPELFRDEEPEILDEDNKSEIDILNQEPVEEEFKITPSLTQDLDLESNIDIKIVKPGISEIDDLPIRVVKKYSNGEKLPDVPGLIPTGTMFDKLICDRFTTEAQLQDYLNKYGEEMPDSQFEAGGFTRKCVDIVAGDPGAGKTTNLCTLAAKAKIFNRRELGREIKVSFISAEMRESEWAKELRDSELLRELEVTYMLDYVGFDNYEDIFWEAFADGDIVICDSFPAVVDHIRMSPKEKRTEKAITADFIRKSLKSVTKNNNNVQLINQATKDGNYKGGTILPHMLSSLSFVRLDGERRYWEYKKNRNNGKVNRRGYFGRTESRDIEFDEDLYNSTYEQVADRNQSIEELMNSLNNKQTNEETYDVDTEEEVDNFSEEDIMGEVNLNEDTIIQNTPELVVEAIPYMGRALPNGQTDLEDMIDNAIAAKKESESITVNSLDPTVHPSTTVIPLRSMKFNLVQSANQPQILL